MGQPEEHSTLAQRLNGSSPHYLQNSANMIKYEDKTEPVAA
jgi:hypothetical protein